MPAIITVAKIINSMRYAQVALISGKEKNPEDVRQQTNSIFYFCALFYEGIMAVRNFGQYFPESKVYENEFKEFFRNNELHEFEEKVLKEFRNTLAFHFDIDKVRRQLTVITPDSDVVFAQVQSDNAGSVFYVLADKLTLASIIPDTDKSGRLVKFSEKFIGAADNLIAETLLDMEWHRKDANSV